MRRLACVTMVMLLACSKHEPPAEPPPEKPAEPPPPRKKIGPADFGSCTLKASGAFTAEGAAGRGAGGGPRTLAALMKSPSGVFRKSRRARPTGGRRHFRNAP